MKAAPQFAEYYNTSLASAKNVELVHMNCDNDDSGMVTFMKEGPFAFPAVPKAKWKKIDFIAKLYTGGVPNYKLVDATGKVIADGAAAQAKAKELAGAAAAAPEPAAETKSN